MASRSPSRRSRPIRTLTGRNKTAKNAAAFLSGGVFIPIYTCAYGSKRLFPNVIPVPVKWRFLRRPPSAFSLEKNACSVFAFHACSVFSSLPLRRCFQSRLHRCFFHLLPGLQRRLRRRRRDKLVQTGKSGLGSRPSAITISSFGRSSSLAISPIVGSLKLVVDRRSLVESAL